MKVFNLIRRLFHRLSRCPLCGGRMHFNWWWLLEAETYVYCTRCCVALAKVGWLVPVLMLAFAAGQLFNYYQDLSALRTDISSLVIKRGILYIIAAAVLRAVLLFILYQLKYLRLRSRRRRSAHSAEREIWWEHSSQ